MKHNKWIIKNKLIYILLFFIPFFILGVLRIGNWIAKSFDININPNGIGNTEWFLFWGAYIAGVCTFIAFMKTIKHNQKSLVFQSQIKKIENEEKVLSAALISFSFRDIYDTLKKYVDAHTIGKFPDQVEVNRILDFVLETRRNLIVNYTRYCIESNMDSTSCKKCKNNNHCKLGKIKIEFSESYEKLYAKFYFGLTDVYDYILTKNMNVSSGITIILSQGEIKIRKGEFAKSKQAIQCYTQQNMEKELISEQRMHDVLKENISLLNDKVGRCKNRIDDKKEKRLLNSVSLIIDELATIEKEDISQLINLCKEYIVELKRLEEQTLQGIPNLFYKEVKSS